MRSTPRPVFRSNLEAMSRSPLSQPTDRRDSSARDLALDLARPYRGWFAVILLAMLVEAAVGLAAPWPLKVVLDYAIEHRPLPHWAAQVLGPGLASNGTGIAAAVRSEEHTSELQ